jgi:phosphoribosylanthranilate isomerase
LRIKICGITNSADGREAATLGADAVGLNFYARSPRAIDPSTAATILAGLPDGVEPVAVFVNPAVDEVCDTLRPLTRIRAVQWHADNPDPGTETPFRLIAVFQVGAAEDLAIATEILLRCRDEARLPAAVLVDARVPGRYGGTGQTAPWALLADFDPGVPLILAGGLVPENVGEAIRIVRPYAVDVAGGVESAPARKDGEKMRRFIASAREAGAKYTLKAGPKERGPSGPARFLP